MKARRSAILTMALGLALDAGAQDVAEPLKPLAATIAACQQILGRDDLSVKGTYEVKVLEAHRTIERFRNLYFSQKKHREMIDDATFDGVYGEYVEGWPGITPWEMTYSGRGRLLKVNQEEQYFDGTTYAKRTMGSNTVVIDGEAVLKEVPEYLGTVFNLNGKIEFGRSFGVLWSGEGEPLAELMAKASGPGGKVVMTDGRIECTIPAFGGDPEIVLLVKIETEPGRPSLPKTIWVARAPAKGAWKVENLTGTKHEYGDYRLVGDNLHLPFEVRGTAYTSFESSFSDPALREELMRHTKLRLQTGVPIPMIEHVIHVSSIELPPRKAENAIKLPLSHGVRVSDRREKREYIYSDFGSDDPGDPGEAPKTD